MFESLLAAVGDKSDPHELKLALYIVIGIVVLVILNTLIDGIRRHIRGLDTAALGALFLFLGHKAAGVKLISVLSNLLYLVGGTLVAVGLLLFIILKLFRRDRKKKTAERSKHDQKPEKAESETENNETPS